MQIFLNRLRRFMTTATSMMSKPKVLVTTPFAPEAGLTLLKKKCDLIILKGTPPSRQEILDNVKGVSGIYWSSSCKLDKEVIDLAGPDLKVVGTLSVGYDHIDVETLKLRNIRLGNTPDVLTDSVAEVAVALCLITGHRLVEGRELILNSKMVLGVHNSSWLLGKEICSSVIGIIGLGRIGANIASKLKAFNPAQILYTGRSEKQEGKELGAKFVTLDTLARESDFIILSCLLSNETRHIINADLINKMKSSTVIVNVSRGEVIDQDALVDALKEKKIWGAGLDVTTPEPLPADHPLLSITSCVITPHLGSATSKTRNAMSVLTAQNILAGLFGEELPATVYK